MRNNTSEEEEAVGDETLGANSLDSEQDGEDILDAKADGAAEDAIVVECLGLIKMTPSARRHSTFRPALVSM